MAAQPRSRDVRHVTADCEVVVLICRKCSRKLDGGFGEDGDERLAKALRRRWRLAPGQDRWRAVAVIEVGCRDLCPKNAVVVLRGDRPGDWLVVPRGTDLGTVGAALGVPLVPEREG